MSSDTRSRTVYIPAPIGTVRVSGAKNAALPLLAATLLASEPQNLVDVPLISDVSQMLDEVRACGARVLRLGERVMVMPEPDCTVPPRRARRPIRASILLLAPQLVLRGFAVVPLPGGCAIGARPIEAHLKGLQAFGAKVSLSEDSIVASAPHGLQGCRYELPFPSVTATELLLMAAVRAQGTTVLHNCAREPEVVALGRFLQELGARIRGLGSDQLHIEGVEELGTEPGTFVVPPDRIEAATWAIAGAVGGGPLRIENAPTAALGPVLDVLAWTGVEVARGREFLQVCGRPERPFSVATGPWPGFPTDCQPLISVLAAVTPGVCEIRETVFERRAGHVHELRKLGLHASVDADRISIRSTSLQGGRVRARDLRCGAAMVLAAFASGAPVTIDDVDQIERGYAGIWRKLERLGATVTVPSASRALVTPVSS